MRRFVAFAALMFMAPLAACQAPAPEAGPLSEEDVAAITASADVFGEATLAGDWAAYAALYTEDAVAILPNGVVVEGRKSGPAATATTCCHYSEYKQFIGDPAGARTQDGTQLSLKTETRSGPILGGGSGAVGSGSRI